ncbi:MAG TPA: SdpI family protein [Flavobacteriales bacterium]|nr:SdpI family protein [Flavobacteriales bacterium]
MNERTTPKNRLFEASLVVLMLTPIGYLAYVWSSLPSSVPLHWNAAGEADRYGDRSELLIPLALVLLLPYAALLLAPRIDPRKKNLLASSKAFRGARLTMALFTCCIALVIVYSAEGHMVPPGDTVFPLCFLMLAGLGNFLPALRSNHFIGIRTPWTIDSEENWRRTHRFGARLYFWGGLAGALIVFLITDAQQRFTFFLPTFLVIALTPVLYSYLLHHRSQRTQQ